MEYDLKKLGKGRIAVIGDFCLDVFGRATVDFCKTLINAFHVLTSFVLVRALYHPTGAEFVAACREEIRS